MEERKLLFSVTKKDLILHTFRSGGPGGQHQNKVETGARIVHPASGASGESRSERSQHANRKAALKRLVASPKFKKWHSMMVHEVMRGKTLDEIVDEMMDERNLKIETRQDGKWEAEERESVK